jgi:hypothetical protein
MGQVALGNSSNNFAVLITNTGQIAMTQPAFAISGSNAGQAADFALNTPTDIPACTSTLNPGASCNIQVVFSPSVLGTESATLLITAANAVPATATVSLTGTGTPSLVLQSSAAALSFPATPVGTASGPKTFALSNIGKKTANNLALALSGPYTLSTALSTCKTSLAANQACTVGVVFNPTANGDQPGSLTASISNDGVVPVTVALDGSGTAVGGISVSPSQFTFGSVVVKAVATTQTLRVTNSGQAALTGLKVSLNGDFSLIGNQCPATLAAGFNCTTGVSFTPSTTGIRTGTLTISTTSAGVVPSVVPLTGNGIPAGSLSPSPAVVSFGTFLVGQTSPSQTVTLSNAGSTTLAGLQFRLGGDFGLPSNACSTQLAPASICTFTVNFSPSVPGTRIGSVTISSTNVGFVPVAVGLTGNGLPTAQLGVSPLQLAFPPVVVGVNSASLQITVHNAGTGTLQGLNFSTVVPFNVGSGSCSTSLAAGASCAVPVLFTPTVPGQQSGAVRVSTTSVGVAAISVALTGTGLVAPAFAWSPATITFAPTTLLTAAPAQTVVLSNPGGAPLGGLTLALSGTAAKDFALAATTCGTSLAAGASCTAAVAFTPSVTGGRQAVLTAGSSTAGVVAKGVSLSGTGLTAASLTLTPAQLTFPATLAGQLSAAQNLTLKNNGQSAVSGLLLTLSGSFALSPTPTGNPCGTGLAGGGSCVIGIVFAPANGVVAVGPLTGALTASVPAQTAITAATAALTGTAAYPPGIRISPAALVQFPTTGVNQPAAPVPVTITNQGTLSALTGLSLSINAQGVANGFSLGSSTCTATLSANASCIANVNFLPTHAPSTPGVLSGALVATSSNGAASATLALAGSAFDFSLFANGASSKTILQGQTAYFTLAATPLGSTSGTIAFTCGTLPANAFCLFNPAQLNGIAANLTSNVSLGIGTGKATSASARRVRASPGPIPVTVSALLTSLLLVLPFSARRRLINWRRGTYPWLCLLGLVLALTAISGCAGAGGAASGLTYTGGGTPPGTYPVTVTATSAGISRTVQFTLIVN